MTPADRRQAWIFFAIAFAVLAAGFGLRDPWPSDEPRFTLVARQMIASGDWLCPHRGSELYSDKPPVFMWLQASAIDIQEAMLIPEEIESLYVDFKGQYCHKNQELHTIVAFIQKQKRRQDGHCPCRAAKGVFP